MNQEENLRPQDFSGESTADFVVAAMRFLRVIRYRKSYIFSAMVIVGLLGALYYLTATRVYQATASLLVDRAGPEMWNSQGGSDAAREAMIPTYQLLFTKPVVIDAAIEKLLANTTSPKARMDLVEHPRDSWRQILQDNLSANVARRSNIIDLSYRSKSPEAATLVVQAVVDAYRDFIRDNHQSASTRIATVIKGEIENSKTELETKRQELLRLEEESGSLGLPKNGPNVHPAVQRVLLLSDQVSEVNSERVRITASLESVRHAVRSGGDLRQHLLTLEPNVGRSFLMTELGLSPQFAEMASETEKQLRNDRAELAKLRNHLGALNPQVIEIQDRIRSAEHAVQQYRSNVAQQLNGVQAQELGPMLVNMLEEKLADAIKKHANLATEYRREYDNAAALNTRFAKLQMARTEFENLNAWYSGLLEQLNKIDLGQQQGDLQVTVVGEPAALNAAVSPKLSVIVLCCLIVGLGAGSGIVYVLDLLDDRFRSPDEMRDQIGAPVLAMVRKLDGPNGSDVESLQVLSSPSSVESEAFRTLRTTLAFSSEEMQRVAVTSSEPGDGKTTVISNLAVSYAQTGKRTLLIDCDLRRPGLSKLFDVRNMPGLTDVLRSDENLDKMCRARIQKTLAPSLEIMPCGPKTPDPTEVLSSARFVDVIAWAETHYDQILIDCPPVMAASDAAIIGRVVDGTILVVQPEKNHRRVVLRAAENLTSMAVHLIGIVANRIGEDRTEGYYGFGYGYGYGYGYGGYGEEDRELGEDGEDMGDDTPLSAPRRAA